MSHPHDQAATPAAATHSSASPPPTTMPPSPLASLVPVVYSGSPALAIRTRTAATVSDASDVRVAADSLASELQSLGCELLRVGAEQRSDLFAGNADGATARLTHVVYNKAYDSDEMAQVLGGHAPSDGRAHHAGFDLQSLLALGPIVWRHCDPNACLGRTADAEAPTLRLFVELAQLSEETLRSFEQWTQQHRHTQHPLAQAKQPRLEWDCAACTFHNDGDAVHCAMCFGAHGQRSSLPPPPPPPPPPPAVPAPPAPRASLLAPTAPLAASLAGASAVTTTDPPSFSVSNFNVLSQDYAAPQTFSYCDRADLAYSVRHPRILAALASCSSSSREGGGGDRRPGCSGGSDIECMQEVDFDVVAGGSFDSPLHGSLFLRRPNGKRDGCLVRWREESFHLLPMPALCTWEGGKQKMHGGGAMPRVRHKAGGPDAQVRIRSRMTPQAECDRLGEKKKRGADKDKGTSSSSSSSASSSSASSLPPPPQADVGDSAAAVELARRQGSILRRLDELTQQMSVLQGRMDAATAAIVASTSTPVPSASASASIAGPPAPPPRFFHPVHFNDLSLLTRSKHNSQSGLFARYKRENVGVVVLLRHRGGPTKQGAAALQQQQQRDPTKDRLVLVVCAHLYYNESFSDVKLHQTLLLLQQVSELHRLVQEQHPHATVAIVFGGDFNSTPSSRVYALLTRGSVPLVSPPLSNVGGAAAMHTGGDYMLSNGHGGHDRSSSGHGGKGQASAEPVIVSSPFHSIEFGEVESQQQPQASSLDSALSSAHLTSSSCPNVRIKLLLDSSLLRVCKWLRAIGVDVVCHSSTVFIPPSVIGDGGGGSVAAATAVAASTHPGDAFFALARRESRLIVTQNKALLRRRGCPPNAYLLAPSHATRDSKDPLWLFQDIVAHCGFQWDADVFYSRCTTCNAPIQALTRPEYEVLPFVPLEYAQTGLDDLGEPLRITKCTNSTSCGRVRWWSSSMQRRTREKLFRARLGVDVSDDEGDEGDDGGDLADEGADQVVTAADVLRTEQAVSRSALGSSRAEVWEDDLELALAASRTSAALEEKIRLERTKEDSLTSSSAVSSSIALPLGPNGNGNGNGNGHGPVVGESAPAPSASDVAALRAARKASKAESKLERAAAASARKQLHREQNRLAVATAIAASFDQQPKRAHEGDSPRSGGPGVTLPASSVALPSTAPRELHSQVLAARLTPAEAQALWWTQEKKAHMLQVETRITRETRRLVRQRREQREREAQDKLRGLTNRTPVPPELEEAEGASHPDAASPSPHSLHSHSHYGHVHHPPSFASQLQRYWQHVADCSLPARVHSLRHGDKPEFHEHALRLASAYAAAAGGSGSEPELTNFTERFRATIDYVLFSHASLRVTGVRELPTEQQLVQKGLVGYPTHEWPSDHLLLAATFQFTS